MIAIVMYKEANWISIASILLSMLSMASKSFIFSIMFAINMKQLFLNWLCAITDFFGIFVMVSWVFYEPKSHEINGSIDLSDAFSVIQTVWFYKLFYILIPIFFISLILLFGTGLLGTDFRWIKKKKYPFYASVCKLVIQLIEITLRWIFYMISSFLMLEILAWTILPGILYVLGTDRWMDGGVYTKSSTLQFWFGLIDWINGAQTHRVGSRWNGYTAFTKKQDKIMRLCAVNSILLQRERLAEDWTMRLYLEENLKENQYLGVTMRYFVVLK